MQFLENELSRLTQAGSMSISEYFLKVKNLCAEISSLDPDEAISEAKLKLYIIGGGFENNISICLISTSLGDTTYIGGVQNFAE